MLETRRAELGLSMSAIARQLGRDPTDDFPAVLRSRPEYRVENDGAGSGGAELRSGVRDQAATASALRRVNARSTSASGADGAAAMATAATAAGRCGVVPLEGDLGRAARPVTPNVGACPPGRGGRTFGAGGGGCGAAGRARRRRGRGVAASPTAKPAAARPSALSTGSGSRVPRRPAGGGLGTDSGSRASSRQPARKSCPPAPPIAAMRWAACRRSRSPTAGAVRESAPECGEAGRGGLPRSKATVVELAAAALSASSCRLPVPRDTEFTLQAGVARSCLTAVLRIRQNRIAVGRAASAVR